ncbi:MAG: DNA alkylation repair protein [bacterium]
MVERGPEELLSWIDDRLALESLIRKEQGTDQPLTAQGRETLLDIAREANQVLSPTASEWARYLSLTLPRGGRFAILVGIFGLGRGAAELDDLFGERLGGLSRALKDRELTDELAAVVGWWARDDLSRTGYLEAWAVRGESVWKKRLSAIATIRFNKEGHSHPAETFRVIRHLMTTEDGELQDAAAKAIRQVEDTEQVERFLAWWAPRISKDLLEHAALALDEESRKKILELA